MSDVLIVGAGSAGSILAERLSADPNCRVTVVEAGPGFDDPAVRALGADGFDVPIGPDSPVVRQYTTALTVHPPRPAGIVRGACVGGSGAVNGGYFCRALPGDVDALAGWSPVEVDEHYRAVESRIPVRTAQFGSLTSTFVVAAARIGYPVLPRLDLDATGVAAVPLNIVDRVRVGPGDAFLAPALGRPNLRLLARTRVTAVRITRGRAVGAWALGPQGPLELSADRVVLAAGAIASAQMLMLSGIGPAGPLRAVGVSVITDLPVGQRCWDHPEWLMAARWPAEEHRAALEAVLVTPDLEVRPYTRSFATDSAAAGSRPPSPDIGVVLTRPRAHGTVSLASSDPATPPRIEHRYDTEPADLAALRHGRDLVRGFTDAGEPVWSTSQHLCGTAPMGLDHDPYAVVDPHCRVRGIDGLWVIDGSVLARIPRRGPHATIAMVAHRAAEFVR